MFAPGDGDDTITDFSTADDTIDLTAFGQRCVLFDDLTIAATTDGTGTVITLPGDDGGTITLQGVTSTDLTADQFVFGTADTPGTLFIGSEAETEFTGTEFADTIIGAEGDDTFDGGRGNDWIFGNEGADNISGGEGNDVIFAGEGADTINDRHRQQLRAGRRRFRHLRGGIRPDPDHHRRLRGRRGSDRSEQHLRDQRVQRPDDHRTTTGPR